MKAIALSRYFEVIHPVYSYYKITPLKSLRNYNSDRLLNLISKMYKSLTHRIIKENKKYFFNAPCKVSYFIYMERDNIEFYFIIPTEYKNLLIDKISDIWKGIAIDNVEAIPLFDETNTAKYAMRYSKNDAFSLATDKRNNVLLTSLTSAMTLMQDGEKLGIVYNFMPTSQRCWRADYDDCIDKFQKGFPIEKDKTNARYILKMTLKIVCSVMEFAFDVISPKAVTQNALTRSKSELQSETIKKRSENIIETQILILSESENKRRGVANATSVCEAFRTIESDNSLDYAPIKSPFNITDFEIKGADKMKTSPMEGQNYLSLPGKSLIEEYHINCIDVMESTVPAELQRGVVGIGVSTYRGTPTPAYLCDDLELRNLALCITGSNRSGKTTLISNIIDDCVSHGECCIVPDFCGNCELTDHLISLFGDKVLSIDYSDSTNMQGMGYNEVSKNETDIFKQYTNAKMQSIQLITLLNSVNEEDKALKAKMDRYMECASLVVFINGGSIKDVFSVLQNHKARHKFIDSVPFTQSKNLEEYIDGLQELDDINKAGEIIGTKFSYIAGIIDRLNALKKNAYIELMLKKSCDNNINLLTEIQKPQIICIRMPEIMFTTSTEKDIFTTYWFSKLWLSLQLRKNSIPRDKHIKVNLIIDELYQVEKCQALIASKLSQIPKFTAKLIVTCHYLDQIPALRTELRASNASYMLLQGSNVKNYDSLKAEFSNLNYSADDLLNLKRYQSLNLLSYTEGYWAGVTQTPPPRKTFTT